MGARAWRWAAVIGLIAVILLCLGIMTGALADGVPPPDLETLSRMPAPDAAAVPFAEEKRRSAMRLAALGFGARGGLARRTWEINGMLERLAGPLSRVYRFRGLLLGAGGFDVLPPAVAETRAAFRLSRDESRAASARRVLRIVEAERLVSAPPHWRDYLVRTWGDPVAPAGVLFPRSREERVLWRGWLAEGWAEGRALADDIFAADLDRLNATFEGVVRWHRLHRARMVSAPDVEVARTAVSGRGDLMRIGETTAELGSRAAFNPTVREWVPLISGGAP